MSTDNVFGDPSALLRFLTAASYWATLFWPLAVTGTVVLIKRKHLFKPGFFIVVGSLTCFGVTFLVGQLHVFWFVPLAASTPSDRLLGVVAGSLIGVFVSAVVLSCFPLYWIYRASAGAMSTSNQRLERP
jgi:hypothetical protein